MPDRGYEETVRITSGSAAIDGDLRLPPNPAGIVIFAHGSGSSRFSGRNRAVAAVLERAGFGTLLMDLLTRAEERIDELTRQHRFDIALLGRRVIDATDWLRQQPLTRDLPVGYFGASTGAGAALMAAGEDRRIAAVVSRGGRPDLARELLPEVAAPTLLIVGSLDHGVIELNQEAFELLRCEKRLEIVPGATHLFEEPGTLQAAADLARRWFVEHLHSAMNLERPV